jgi:signal transduction histidine kinase/DNA-binding response OmpR family regulator
VALIGIFLLLTGCQQKKTFVIGVSQCSNDIWREKLNEELRTSAYLYDNVKVHFSTALDNDKLQTAQIDSFISEGVDLLIVSPNQLHTISAAINRAYKHHIPVILFDRKTDSPHYTAFMGADNYRIGKTMGEYIAHSLHGQGTLMEIRGLNGSSPAIERHKGLVDALSDYPGVKLLDSEAGDWTKESGRKAMERMLKRHQKVDYVFGQNDRMAIGAREVLRATHPADTTTRFVGIDALATSDGGIGSVKRGELQASYIYPTRGDKLMQLAMNILNGKEYAKENLLQSAIVTKDNADVVMLQADELSKQNERLEQLHQEVDRFFTAYNNQKVFLVLTIIILLLAIVTFLVIYRAIIMRKRLVEQTTNAKLVFFTNVSHELRTPLTLITAPINQLYNDDSLSADNHRLLGIAKRNTDILLRLVNEVLDFRKVQNGKMELQLQRFNLTPLITNWVEMFEPSMNRKNLKLHLECPNELIVVSDILKLERICYNLMSNALKYTQDGGNVWVKVKAGDQRFSIIVEDDGIGIPKDKLGKVFERFMQVDPTQATGTGVGLALVKAFAELMGGRVTAENRQPKGTTFTVDLPREVSGEVDDSKSVDQPDGMHTPTDSDTPEEQQRSRHSSAAITDPEHSQRFKVLVVDDNDDIRTYVSQLLEPFYDVLTAANGKEAFDLARREVPDLVLTDVMMPVMDGMELCRKIKNDMATSHIPVLLLTAKALDQQRAEAYNCGADAFITKPFDGEVLLARVKNLIDNRLKLRDRFGNTDTPNDSALTTDQRFEERFRQALQQNLGNSELNVEQIGEMMGLSRVQLYRKVKAMTGQSPVEILREARLKRAERMLATTDLTVAEIAYEVGFSSPSYFNKCYKDYFGHSPKER